MQYSNYMAVPGLKSKNTITLDFIMDCVSDVLTLPKEKIKQNTRCRAQSEARNLFSILARNITKGTLKEIGDYLGKDHTTVIHSIKVYNNLMDIDKRYRALYDHAKRLIA